MHMLTLILVVFIIFFFEAVFCGLMKRRQEFRIKQVEKKVPEANQNSQEPHTHSSMIIGLLKFASDFTFLLFKVVGYFPSHHVRNFLYKTVFHMSIDKKVVIYYGLEARSPWNIHIGKGSIIGDHAIMDARYGINIGDNVNLSTGVWIWTLQHNVNSPVFGTENKWGGVQIGNHAWVSSRVTVLPGCEILEGDVVAAGAVLTKSCERKFGIYGGVPAKLIGERSSELCYEFDGGHRKFL